MTSETKERDPQAFCNVTAYKRTHTLFPMSRRADPVPSPLLPSPGLHSPSAGPQSHPCPPGSQELPGDTVPAPGERPGAGQIIVPCIRSLCTYHAFVKRKIKEKKKVNWEMPKHFSIALGLPALPRCPGKHQVRTRLPHSAGLPGTSSKKYILAP